MHFLTRCHVSTFQTGVPTNESEDGTTDTVSFELCAGLTRAAALGIEFELPCDSLLPAVLAIVQASCDSDVHHSVTTAALNLGPLLIA